MGLLCFYSSLNLFNLSAATKNLRTNYTLFIKLTRVALIVETRRQWQVFEVDFDYIRQKLTFCNLFYCKTYTRDVFRTQSIIYNKAFVWYLQRSSIIDVCLGSKYASAYIYIWVVQVSYIEIICILNIFVVKYIFSYQRMKSSSSKWIKGSYG